MTDFRLAQVRRAKASLRALASEATCQERRVLLDLADDFENRAAQHNSPRDDLHEPWPRRSEG